jgi:hypothetical protein
MLGLPVLADNERKLSKKTITNSIAIGSLIPVL